jgi:hypothetical protein
VRCGCAMSTTRSTPTPDRCLLVARC